MNYKQTRLLDKKSAEIFKARISTNKYLVLLCFHLNNNYTTISSKGSTTLYSIIKSATGKYLLYNFHLNNHTLKISTADSKSIGNLYSTINSTTGRNRELLLVSQ